MEYMQKETELNTSNPGTPVKSGRGRPKSSKKRPTLGSETEIVTASISVIILRSSLVLKKSRKSSFLTNYVKME
ncbi:hypothetical protein GcM1_250256 [Golovinomyces cichoracearum]|uniref:Uncharacterized protein n=1 Tax=Golovinomyces cichoracearum TaxID=62708 RepID=A0A420IBC5_9PEZI|nr:hypothetical protein GcM1_250256 [Golovinomyces cichoracearum]